MDMEYQFILFSLLAILRVNCHIALHRRDIFYHNHENETPIFVPEPSEEITEIPKKTTKNGCVPFIQCPAHVRMNDKQLCKTEAGRDGIVCTTGQNHTTLTSQRTLFPLDNIMVSQINRRIKSDMADLRTLETRLLKERDRTVLSRGPAAYGHFRNSRTFNLIDFGEVMGVASNALQLAMATKAFKDRQGLTNEDMELGTFKTSLRTTAFGTHCRPKPFCPIVPGKYRTIDGTCNNGVMTTWGAAFTPYSRLLPPSYDDGIWEPRTSVNGGQPLPSPRLISGVLFKDSDTYNSDYTLMLMQFGQFLSHDLTQSIDISFDNASAISCCSPDGKEELPTELKHYACFPISIPESDGFYGQYNQRCMNFVRSVLAPNHDCTLGYAQQMNKLTHFIDGSNIYGSTSDQLGELRQFESGKLKVFHDFGRDLLPLSKDSDACLTMEQGSACFETGDTRANQVITLIVLHTLFLREHNRVASILESLNPHWNDEQIFLEARDIVVAELQVITYKEFLPALIGESAINEFGLHLQHDTDYAFDYDSTVDPSVTNEFASAAFRFGHTIVDGRLKVYGKDKMEEIVALAEVMFYPSRMRQKKFMDQVLSSLTVDPIQEVDTNMAEALTRYLFKAGNPFGVDLASINIQRGRDHGMRPYNDYRELSGLPRIHSFDEFGPEIGARLKSIYSSVDDIDLWVGGLLEPKAPGSLVGHTFRDMIADQFLRLKRGDRYFFENAPSIHPGYFEPDQLRELRKASMSRIICDNSDGYLLARQAPNAFRKPGVPGNEFFDCSGPEIPRIDLIHWQE